MAFRLNTVEYGWETLQTAVSGSTPVAGAEKLVYIPETGSRTFLCVDLEMYVRDANTGLTIGTNFNTWQMSCSIDDNLLGRTVSGGTIATTVDHTCLVFKNNFVDDFNQRFTGSVHRVVPMFNIPMATKSGRWNGHSFKMTITYQFNDDGSDTRVKTARLPLDTIHGSLSNTIFRVFGKQTGGYTNIPALDTFLPESNKSIKDIWVEFKGLDISSAATNVAMATRIDSGSANSRMTIFGSMNTDTSLVDFLNLSGSLDTSTPHTLQASASLASRLSNVAPILHCTYEYNSALSTKVLNSYLVPLPKDMYFPMNIGMPQFNSYFSYLIPERDPYLINSALIVHYGLITTARQFKINNVPVLSNYTVTRGAVLSAMPVFNLRFDSEASSSANVTLRSGYNTLDFNVNGASSSPTTGVNPIYPVLLLNYTSSKLANGIDSHNSIIHFNSSSLATRGVGAPISLKYVSESFEQQIKDSFYLDSVASLITSNMYSGTTEVYWLSSAFTSSLLNFSSSMGVEVFKVINNSAELGYKVTYFNTDFWKKYPREPDIFPYRNNFFDSLNYNFLNLNQIQGSWAVSHYLNLQQNIFRITGSLLNCNQTGVNYEVDIMLSGSNAPVQPIYVLNSSGSGATKWFTFDWYEDINKLYAITQYPEKGVSNLATASSGQGILTIDYSTPSSGGERSFTFIG